jgi:hypothetical protein
MGPVPPPGKVCEDIGIPGSFEDGCLPSKSMGRDGASPSHGQINTEPGPCINLSLVEGPGGGITGSQLQGGKCAWSW